MGEEIGERHLARQDEGGRPREQAGGQQRPADQLERAGKPAEREQRRQRIGGREAEQLGGAVLQEQQRHHDAHDAEHIRRNLIEAVVQGHGASVRRSKTGLSARRLSHREIRGRIVKTPRQGLASLPRSTGYRDKFRVNEPG